MKYLTLTILLLLSFSIKLNAQANELVMPKFEYYPEFGWITNISRGETVYPFCKFEKNKITKILVFNKINSKKERLHEYSVDENGVVFSIKYIRNNENKISNEFRKSLGNSCYEDLIWKGEPNSKYKYQSDDNKIKGEITVLEFNEYGYLATKKKLRKGIIKYNNSWAGSLNTCTKYSYDIVGNVIEILEYYSHTRFFKKVLSSTAINYTNENLPILFEHKNYIDGNIKDFIEQIYVIEYVSK